MTPRPWEADFIRLWEAAATQAQIAAALDIPRRYAAAEVMSYELINHKGT